MADDRVLVTGASGFIATHIVQQLLQAGYRVRGTVRNIKNEDKVKPLRELCPGSKYPLELVEAELTQPGSWKGAVKGCTYVIHTASPCPIVEPENEDDIVKPAVEGTLSVFRACQEVESVKRVVLTSSSTAVTGSVVEGVGITEERWGDPNTTTSFYIKSKILAERAAWNFVYEHKEEGTFELCVLNPSYVLGPVLCGCNTVSTELPRRLLEREIPLLPRILINFVDVRDVAEAHITAMHNTAAAGHRHLMNFHHIYLKDVAMILSETFHPLGYKVPTFEVPDFVVKIAAFFNATAKRMAQKLGNGVLFDCSRMTEVLGIYPRDAKDTLVDMGYSMIEKGRVKKTDIYMKAKPKLKE